MFYNVLLQLGAKSDIDEAYHWYENQQVLIITTSKLAFIL